MDIPINFPSDADVIAEDAARFRALDPDEQVHELGEAVRLYYFLADHAARPEAVARYAAEDEARGRAAIRRIWWTSKPC